MRSAPTWLWRGFAGLTVIFMLTPMVLVVLFSFGENTLTNFPMGGVTVKWYVKLAKNPEFWNALNNSLTVAGSVALVSTLVGTLAALAIARLRPTIAGPWLIALSLPMMMPPLVVAVGAGRGRDARGVQPFDSLQQPVPVEGRVHMLDEG